MNEDPPSMTGTRTDDALSCAPDRNRLQVDVSMGNGFWGDSIEDAERLATQVLEQAWPLVSPVPVAFAEVSVRLTDDSEIAYLNQAYRGKEGPTNVLSFPVPKGQGGTTVTLGDIVLAHETVQREAEAQSKTFTDHFTHLILHGMLHLLGYDHEGEADALEMETLERRILGELGISDPYDGGPFDSRTQET